MLIDFPILTYIVLLPAVGAVFTYISGSDRAARAVALAFSLIVLGLSTILLTGFLWTNVISLPTMTTAGNHTYFAVEESPWVPSLNVNYILGADELSVVLVFLNALLTPLALAIGWDEHHRVPAFFAMFLFMETTINGVFLSLDLFQFFVFWEVGLIPMYFLIAVWGGPRKKYAAIMFFMYTFLASLPLLVAIFAFYFYSSPHTFDMRAIIATTPIPAGTIGDLMFVALLIAFGTKLPPWPLHTWLPDAHVEAPTGGSVILAGVLLKMGTYGFLRFAIPLFPEAAHAAVPAIMALAVIGIIYGALVAMVQPDLKKLVAYSSVSHLGFVVLGLFAFNVQGVEGAVYQMLNHGLSTGALFLLVGVVYERRHTRLISEYGGLWQQVPRYASIFLVVMLSSIGLPGLNGFVGEFLILLGAFKANIWAGGLAVSGVVLGAVYMLWMY